MKFQKFNVDDRRIYNALMSSIDDYIYIGDLTTNMYLVSKNMLEDFELPGRLVRDLVGLWGDLIHEKDKARFFASIQDMLDGKSDFHNEEYQIRNRQGQYVWVHCRGTLNRDLKTGEPLSFIGVVKKPASIGKIDSVTGLHTHEKCLEAIAALVQDGNAQKAGLIILGIDDFARINTLKTHHFGDIVLRNVAQDLMKMIYGGVQLFRYDGDQFAVLFCDAKRETLTDFYSRVQSYTEERHVVNGQECSFTISAGAVCLSEIGSIGENADKCASIALKEAKAGGKNRCVFFEPGMLDYKVREQIIVQELGKSIRNDFTGFHMVFQPIADATTLKITGAEALLRYESAFYGPLGPDEFIPLLENAGLILQAGQWVLSKSVETCARWREQIPGFRMNVNVSCLQFRDDDFPRLVKEELERWNLPAKCLTLEMTETYFVTDIEHISAVVSSLRSMGCKIAMDDFGTGYSSLGRLTEFNIDIVKIDRLFVRSLNANHYNYSFVEAVIHLCHSAGMSVCIEGVETEEEQQGVSTLHADHLQGYYLSRPVSEEEFERTFLAEPDCMCEKTIDRKVPSHHLKMSGDKDLLFLMMDSAPICLNLWNEDLQNVECNKTAVRVFGLQNEVEYLNRFYELSPKFQPDGSLSEEKVKERVKEAFEKGERVFFWMHCKPNGEPVPSEVTLVRLRYKGEFIVAGYARDLRRQIALDVLEESKYHVFDTLPEPLAVADAEKKVCLYANQLMSRLLETEESLPNLSACIAYPHDVNELMEKTVKELDNGKEIFTAEVTLKSQQDKLIKVLVRGSYMWGDREKLILTFHDNSSQVKARKKHSVKQPFELRKHITHLSDNDIIYHMFDLLYETDNLEAAFQSVLQNVAVEFSLDCCGIYEFDEAANGYRNTFVWYEGEEGTFQGYDRLMSDKTAENILKLCGEDSLYYTDNIDSLGNDTAKFWQLRGISSFVIYMNKEGQGSRSIISYEVRAREHQWKGKDIAALLYISKILDIYLKNRK